MRLVPAGPHATLLELEAAASPETSRYLANLRRRLAATAPPEVRDLVPGFTSLLIEHRPTLTRRSRQVWLERAARAPGGEDPGRLHTLRVAYGLDADVQELETRLGLPFDEIARVHLEHEATVAFLGFTPGFPYLLGLPARLQLPRRERPLERVPAGAVAIAAGSGGIYPSASPGGWWIVGKTDAQLFDPDLEPPSRLAPGDRLRFEAVEPAQWRAPEGRERDALTRPAGHAHGPFVHVVEAVAGSASLQSAPRWGGGHQGLAQAGVLDPPALDAGNRMVGNPADASALELLGQPLVLRSEATRRVAVTGGGTALALEGRAIPTWRAFTWPAGTTLELLPDASVSGRTCLLCVQGGFAAEDWHGSRSTDLRAGAGGSGRALRPGDTLALGEEASVAALVHPGRPLYPPRTLLRLYPGPQYDAAAFEALVNGSFRLAASDRTGARLEGSAVSLPQHEVDSDGSPWGAVQIPPDGAPIVLLADRGRTGGYAKPAVADPRDLWRLAQARPRGEVWFVDGRRGAWAAEPLDSEP